MPVHRAAPTRSAAPVRWLSLGLVAAGLLAYANSFQGAFVFDDVPSILENPSLHGWRFFEGPGSGGLTTSGRPLAALTLAANWALGGANPVSYHAVNLAIHLAAGLLLFGLVRRTAGLAGREEAAATHLGAAVALLWLVHPLQTASVTYVVQRVEGLAGFFGLAALLTFARSLGAGSPGRWQAASVAGCVAGMACKESVAALPLLVLLYDRTWGAGSFAEAWRRRKTFYLALACTWLPLAWLVASTGGRGGTAGLGAEIGPGDYLLTQGAAILHYLRLVFWPDRLVFDYGVMVVPWREAVVPAGLVALLLLASLVALWRRPAWGFLGVAFFALLAPSSSVVPVATQTMAEHRLYLPLAAVLAAVAAGLQGGVGRRFWWVVLPAALALGWRTQLRNEDYRSEAELWRVTAAVRPENTRAHNNLGQALYREGKRPEAAAAYGEALARQPHYPEAHFNLGLVLVDLGRRAEAREHFAAAVAQFPGYLDARNQLGTLWLEAGQPEKALAEFLAARATDARHAPTRTNLGLAYGRLQRWPEALAEQREAVRLEPGDAGYRFNLARAEAANGMKEEAIASYQEALRLRPDYAEAHGNLGGLLAASARWREAEDHFRAALRLAPEQAASPANLAHLLVETGRPAEAVPFYEAALRLDPDFVPAHAGLGLACARLGRWAEARSHYERAAQLAPGDEGIRRALQRLSPR